MVPAWRPFCANVSDHVAGHSILGGKFIKKPPAARRSANCDNVSFSKFCVRAGRPSLRVGSPMADHIAHVFSARSPSQIGGFIVGSDAVSVGNIILIRWWSAMKRLANQPMHLERLLPPINSKPDQMIPPPSADTLFAHQATVGAPHSAKAGDFVVRCAWASFPNFSHAKPHNQRKVHTMYDRVKQVIAGYAMQFESALAKGGWL